MLIAFVLAAAAQTASPPPVRFQVPGAIGRPCPRDAVEQAGNGVLYRRGDRPAEQRRLDELPDADMVLTVLKRDEVGCPIIDIVRRGVRTPDAAPMVGAPLQRAPALSPQRRPERQR